MMFGKEYAQPLERCAAASEINITYPESTALYIIIYDDDNGRYS